MRLISLEIESFLKFQRLALEFPDGLTGILGPNGVGKSSLVEAVAWALYGSPASRTRNEGIPFRRNVPCRVVLTLEIEGDEYRVVRELRGASCTAGAEVFVNGVPTEAGTERVNRLIATRLRMDHRAFLVSCFARQKEVDALISWEPRERKRYILRMLGLARVEQAIEEARRDVTDLSRELRVREAALPALDTLKTARDSAREKAAALAESVKTARAALDAAEQELRAARERLETLEKQQERYVALQRERDLARQALENARREEAIFADRVRDLTEKVAELRKLEPLRAPLDGLREELRALDLAAGLQKRRAFLLRSIAANEKTTAELAAQIRDLEKQAAARKDAQTSYDAAEEAVTKHRDELGRVQGQIHATEARLTQIKKEGQKLSSELAQIKEMGRQGKCPTCRRALDGSHASVVDHLETELSALRQEHDEYTGFIKEDNARAEELKRALQEAEALRQRFNMALHHAMQAEARLGEVRASLDRAAADQAKARAELAEIGTEDYDAAAHREVRARVAELEKIDRRVIGLKQDADRLPAEEQAMAKARQAIPERQRALAEAEAALAGLSFDAAAFAKHKQHCRALEDRRETASTAHHRLERERERADAERQQAEDRMEDYYRQMEEITIRRARKENLDELLALMQAFRVNLIGRIRPALSARTSALVRDLTDGKYDHVELDEDYNLWMFDGSERRELRAFSGGENDLVHLCLRLAISEMIGDAAGGAEHGFLVLDEVLSSQDGERRALILQALGKLSRRFRQILMITHVDEIKEMVEHVVELRETPNGSSEIAPAGIPGLAGL